ncbi:hypothetical protein B0T22DRAFT_226554 [Podospora appendiculata]|uniref:Uncharacterized protein n=1 Tax=Podospora appendiculata TaxID=314037 RepID=A0AAE0X5Y2_9PEZI|nr:hypothetical protein B0T22DRAFT_226554 [Podospora appendiculata]
MSDGQQEQQQLHPLYLQQQQQQQQQTPPQPPPQSLPQSNGNGNGNGSASGSGNGGYQNHAQVLALAQGQSYQSPYPQGNFRPLAARPPPVMIPPAPQIAAATAEKRTAYQQGQELVPGPNQSPDANLPPNKRRKQDVAVDVSRLPELPPHLEQMPDICKANYTALGPVGQPAQFSYDMKVIILTTINQVDVWTKEVEAIAQSCGCYRELTTRFGGFPKPGTVEAFICQTRFMACWRILTETISGPVWSYMRSLGYSKIPVFKGADGVQWQPGPVDCFYYAKEAGYRLLIPGSNRQARIEVMRMVEEIRVGKEEDYPSEKHYKKGRAWLKTILDNMIRNGDRQVCESMYDLKPDWAPEWHEDAPHEPPWILDGAPLRAETKRRRPRNSKMVVAEEQRRAQASQSENQPITAAPQQQQSTPLPSDPNSSSMTPLLELDDPDEDDLAALQDVDDDSNS